MGRFEDRVAIVTGAGSGTGAAIAARLAEEGAHVVCTDVNGAEERTAATLGERCHAARLNVTDADAVAGLVAEVRGLHGRLDALFNCAGVDGAVGPLTDLSEENFELVVGVNLKGPFLTMKHAIPLMVEGGGGAVVCMSSRAAVAPFRGGAGYAAAKAAVLAFAQAVAVEYRADGVRCNAVLPSVIDTPANRAAQPDADFSRWVPPQQVAAVIRFLCGEESAPTSGAAIPVYGRA